MSVGCSLRAHCFPDPCSLRDVVVFLCSDWASYVTGTDLLVDGGFATAKKF